MGAVGNELQHCLGLTTRFCTAHVGEPYQLHDDACFGVCCSSLSVQPCSTRIPAFLRSFSSPCCVYLSFLIFAGSLLKFSQTLPPPLPSIYPYRYHPHNPSISLYLHPSLPLFCVRHCAKPSGQHMNYHGLTFLGSLSCRRQVLCSQECYNGGMTQNIQQLKALGQLGGRSGVQSVTPEGRKFEDSRSEGWAEVGKGHPKD